MCDAINSKQTPVLNSAAMLMLSAFLSLDFATAQTTSTGEEGQTGIAAAAHRDSRRRGRTAVGCDRVVRWPQPRCVARRENERRSVESGERLHGSERHRTYFHEGGIR